MFFAEALKRLTGGKHNLFKNKRLYDNPVTFPLHIYLPGNKSLNFEDSGGEGWVGSTHLINKLATETQIHRLHGTGISSIKKPMTLSISFGLDPCSKVYPLFNPPFILRQLIGG